MRMLGKQIGSSRRRRRAKGGCHMGQVVGNRIGTATVVT
jgi:hypothetical protein